ncbi:MAG: molybdopterin molybdotransferase MoeA [Verrucomicrobia bacterium]|nr:molybdopterin molybdotransferase MoeA [Verrucomicrobiota bacterium]MCH8528709.1 molybdopterin molybdotransferase MoeA [Kiritimatiellia bacterium]
MIPVAEAFARLRDALPDFGTEPVALSDAVGRILREPLRAERDAPPFDRVMLDGVAVSHAALAAGRSRFPVAGLAPAGQPRARLLDPQSVLEVMTGAPLPEGADTVVPVEDLEREGDAVRILDVPEKGQGVHRRASDARVGDEVLPSGTRLRPAALAVAATEGALTLQTARRPVISLLTSGDEVVPPDAQPLDHQIRASHPAALAALLRGFGHCISRHRHAPDDPVLLKALLAEALESAEILLVTGGVSKGSADHVPRILGELGVRGHFHGVAQRPGKPLWCGSRGKQVVLALPGNPLSALTCARRYLIPALDAAMGALPEPPPLVRPLTPPAPHPTLATFRPLRVTSEGWEWVIPPNSGALHVPALTQGFLECPPGFSPPDLFPFYAWT